MQYYYYYNISYSFSYNMRLFLLKKSNERKNHAVSVEDLQMTMFLYDLYKLILNVHCHFARLFIMFYHLQHYVNT